jgi:hypothetical protein
LPGGSRSPAILLQWHLDTEAGDAHRRWLRRSNLAESFSQSLIVKLAVSAIAEFVSPEESEGTDFFTAIQATHEVPRQNLPRIITSISVEKSRELPRYSAGFS